MKRNTGIESYNSLVLTSITLQETTNAWNFENVKEINVYEDILKLNNLSARKYEKKKMSNYEGTYL